jgi:hypothetical protein
MMLLAALLSNYGRGKCLINIGTEGTVTKIEQNETSVHVAFERGPEREFDLVCKVARLPEWHL